jgi:hypothetical protein
MPIRVIYNLQPNLAAVLDYLTVTIPSLDLSPDPTEPRGFIQVDGEDDQQTPQHRVYYPLGNETWIIRSSETAVAGTLEDVVENLTSLLPFYVAVRTTLNTDPIVLWDVNSGSSMGSID